MQEKEIKAIPAPPETKSWFEYSWKLQQEAPVRFEDAAKFLATIISITVTILFTALDNLKVMVPHPVWLFIILVVGLISLLFAFMVLYPHKYKFSSKSIESIKNAQIRILRTKRNRFVISAALYFSVLVSMTILYLISILEAK